VLEARFGEMLRAAGIEVPGRYVEVTGSTNSDLMRLAEEGAPEWTVLAAGHQTAGRGRLGRAWATAPGASLALSVLLRPEATTAELPLFGLAAGVAMAEACREGSGVDVRCKWPNDLVAETGKVGGILSEAVVGGARPAFAVVGVGVNLAQSREDFPEEVRPVATSLRFEGGEPDVAAIVAAYLRRLRALYSEGAPGLAGRVVEPYRRLCETVGRAVAATTTEGRRIEGRAVDVADSGDLLVQVSDRIERVGFGEVEYLRRA
jgi:BirA family biotin operon repressor/biotin-[acetyl-CoA-carboxylase] ligase